MFAAKISENPIGIMIIQKDSHFSWQAAAKKAKRPAGSYSGRPYNGA
jgi:hypothetical protein